jgi:Cytochrome c554 and c-prime
VRWLLVLLSVTSAFGSPVCAECHDAIYRKQRVSRHAQALRPYAGSRMALALGPGTSLEWAFGAGAQGFTAVGRSGGKYFEYRISWFIGPGRPGLTPGQSGLESPGVFKAPEEAFACFRCHSTGLMRDNSGGPDVTAFTPGLTCERCHGPGEKHVAAAREHLPASIFNAAHLPARASVEVCGECHRTTANLSDPVTVRFQPVGLMASRCFRESGRLSCVTCHDPHDDAVRSDAAYYRAKCLGCHTDCRRGERGNCLSCHMRQVALTPYLTFTDHRIRVY